MADLSALLKEIDRTRAVVVGAAQNALWFLEARDLDQTEQLLRSALDEHNRAVNAYRESLLASPRKENENGNRSAA